MSATAAHFNNKDFANPPSEWNEQYHKLLRVHRDKTPLSRRDFPDTHNNEAFNELAAEFTASSRAALTTDVRAYRRNLFFVVFLNLVDIDRGANVDFATAKMMQYFMLEALRTHTWHRPVEFQGNLLDFNSRSSRIKVGGFSIPVDGFVYPCIAKRLLVTVLISQDPQLDYYRTTQYHLLQHLTHHHLPHEQLYKALVIYIRGTRLQLITACVSHSYLVSFTKNQQPGENMTIRASRQFDLMESEDRREWLRLFMGFLEEVDGLYDRFFSAEGTWGRLMQRASILRLVDASCVLESRVQVQASIMQLRDKVFSARANGL